MNETELEKMVIRLSGDGTDYQKMLEEAEAQTRTLMQESTKDWDAIYAAIERQGEATKGLMSQQEAQTVVMKAAGEVTRSVVSESERYAAKMSDLNALLSAGAITQETYNRAVEQTNQSLNGAGQQAAKLAEGYKQQAATFGMTSREAQIYRLQMQGATQDQVAQAKTANDQLTVLEQQAASMARGAQITAANQTVQERYSKQMGELGSLLKSGAISQDTYSRASGQLQQQMESLKGTTASFGDSFRNLSRTITGSLATLGLFNWLNGARVAFESAEKNAMKLRAAIEANGGSANAVEEDYKNFSKAIQDTTTQTAQGTLTLLRRVEAYGLTGDVAKAAVKNAIALAAVNDGEASSYLRVTAALAQGNVQLLRRLPGLRGIKDETELLAKAQQMLATGFKLAEAEGTTISASINRLWASFNVLRREIGAMVDSALRPVVAYMQQAVNWFNALDPFIRKLIVSVGGLVASLLLLRPVLMILGPVLSIGLGPLQFMISLLTHIPSLWAVIGATVKLVASTIVSLGAVILTWINPITLVQGAFSLLVGVMGSLFSVIGMAFSPITIAITAAVVAVYQLVQSFGGLEPAWNALRTGAGTAVAWVKAKFAEFLVFVRPITDALVSLFTTTWHKVTEGATVLYGGIVQVLQDIAEFVGSVWQQVMGDTKINWETIREVIVTVIKSVEFVVSNLGTIINTVWEGIKTTASTLWGLIAPAFNAIAGLIQDMWSRVVANTAPIWETVKQIIVGAVAAAFLTISAAATIVSTAWDAVIITLNALYQVAAVLGDVFLSVGKVVLTVFNPVIDLFLYLGQIATDWAYSLFGVTSDLEVTLKGLTATLFGVGAAVLAGVAAYYIVTAAISATIFVLRALHVQQILSNALWVAWKAAVFVAMAPLALFNAVLAVYNGIMSMSVAITAIETIGIGIYNAAVVVAKILTAGWAAALVTLNAAMSLAGFVSFIVTIGLITAAFGLVTVAITTVYNLSLTLLDAFALLPGAAAGPLSFVKDLFGEWVGIIKDIYDAMTVDIPTAWKMVQVAGKLAVAQFENYWPPVWKFIKDGFEVLSDAIGIIFQVTMNEISARIKYTIMDAITFSPLGKTDERKQRDKDMEDAIKAAADDRAYAIKELGEKLEDVAGRVKIPKASEEIKKVSKEFNDLREHIKDIEFEKWLDEFFGEENTGFDKKKIDELNKQALNVGTGIGQAIGKGIKDSKIDAALFGSAEALARIQKYKDSLLDSSKGSKDILGGATGGGGTGGAAEATNNAVKQVTNAINSVGAPQVNVKINIDADQYKKDIAGLSAITVSITPDINPLILALDPYKNLTVSVEGDTTFLKRDLNALKYFEVVISGDLNPLKNQLAALTPFVITVDLPKTLTVAVDSDTTLLKRDLNALKYFEVVVSGDLKPLKDQIADLKFLPIPLLIDFEALKKSLSFLTPTIRGILEPDLTALKDLSANVRAILIVDPSSLQLVKDLVAAIGATPITLKFVADISEVISTFASIGINGVLGAATPTISIPTNPTPGTITPTELAAGAADSQRQTVELLKKAVEYLAVIADNPTIDISGADL